MAPSKPETVVFSVVVPAYKEEGNIPAFLRRLLPILNSVTDNYEVIFAVDPSPDKTEKVILEAHTDDPRIKMISFSRRFGQPMATLAGLKYSRGETVVIMDADLQDPPELIPEMVEKYRQGYDVVVAQRKSRDGETLVKRFVSYVGYKLINRISHVEIPRNTGDFRLLSRRVIEQINQMEECHGFLRGMVAYAGFRHTLVQFDRSARHDGTGHYNLFIGSLRIGLNGVFCFSNQMLGLSALMGFTIAGISFVIALVCLILKLTGFPLPLGFTSLVALTMFIGGIQLICIGVLGAYIARIYEEVRVRPRFIVERAVGFPSSQPNKTSEIDGVAPCPAGVYCPSTQNAATISDSQQH